MVKSIKNFQFEIKNNYHNLHTENKREIFKQKIRNMKKVIAIMLMFVFTLVIIGSVSASVDINPENQTEQITINFDADTISTLDNEVQTLLKYQEVLMSPGLNLEQSNDDLNEVYLIVHKDKEFLFHNNYLIRSFGTNGENSLKQTYMSHCLIDKRGRRIGQGDLFLS